MDTSRPPTPPSGSATPDANRFGMAGPACEWGGDYRPGSYHPVEVGDVLGDGQYKVLRKLGYGSFSTVWLARDLTKPDGAEHSIVAIKVVVAHAGPAEGLPEGMLYKHLASVSNAAVLDRHVTKLLSTFAATGPNGTHACLVFEPMGPGVHDMVENLPQFVPRTRHMKVRYPFWMARQIVRGALEALAFVHAHGMAHGDVQPGNFLFTLKDRLDRCTDDELQRPAHVHPPMRLPKFSAPLTRLDGKVDPWAPTQLYVPQPMADWADAGPGLSLKLSDLGGAYLAAHPPAKIVSPKGLRAPELILQTPTNGLDGLALDVWAVGCLVFELVTGQQLFCLPWMPRQTEEDRNDEHLLQMVALLGPLSDAAWARWTRSSRYFSVNDSGQRTLFNLCVAEGKPIRRPEDAHPDELQTMEQLFDRLAPDVSDEEARATKRLVRRILQCDPAQRPTAAEILQDPWFLEGGEMGVAEE
ncbi:non-specific serine/threonineeeee protein kinase [Sporothrix brasiliensis 5110]|uniref:non-specific serine/threonine protein kinase n=1 Tax=Sporothrix brasiliensis 5110 TaxID=1398154 RepID=A0A0C2FV09_9PEZI|nr:non-specific serine/threonineeeee protein kinase [Sporothrix brasiliensis 5110]KIH94878.1 non-specific serine/threonineeeee protein kinase [Sporothrix brasiliensis 5110]